MACDKDDDMNEMETFELNEENLLGKWTWIAGTEDGISFELEECDKLDFYDFKANNILNRIVYFGTEDVNADGSVTVECKVDNEVTGTFKVIDNNTIVENYDNEIDTLKVVSFTAQEITFEAGTYEDEDGVLQIDTDTYTKAE